LDDASGVTLSNGNAGAPARGARRRGKSSGPTPYDFRRPTKLSREHVRILQIAYETFARQFSTLLTTSLRAVSQVSLAAVEQLTYDEYVNSLTSPTLMATFTAEPLAGTSILELSLDTAMTAVDHLLGGPGVADQPQRPLTEIESMLVRGLLDRALAELRYAFESMASLQLKLSSVEYNPQFVQACPPSDTVIIASFEMRVGVAECVMTLCMPFNAMLPKLQQAVGRGPITARQKVAREVAAKAMSLALEGAPIDVAVRFDATTLHPEEILGLNVGDVVTLRHPASRPLEVVASDVTFAHAVPGANGARLACLVVDAPQEDPS
jgi:flagellar motor switch protein FliM